MQPLVQTPTLLVVCQLLAAVSAKYLLNSLRGEVGAGNYTYHKLSREGVVILVLDTKAGDADLYISDKTSSPDWENFDMKSVTCGIDEIEVPADFKRPVWVGIYGHPSNELSIYDLYVYIGSDDSEHRSSDYDYSYTRKTGGPKMGSKPEDEESVLWTIFVSILKIILDILV